MEGNNDLGYVFTQRLRQLLIALSRSFFFQDLGRNRTSLLRPFDMNDFLDKGQGHRERWRGLGSPRLPKGFEPFIEVLDGLIKELKQRPPIAARLYALQCILYQEMGARGDKEKPWSWFGGGRPEDIGSAQAAVVSYFSVVGQLDRVWRMICQQDLPSSEASADQSGKETKVGEDAASGPSVSADQSGKETKVGEDTHNASEGKDDADRDPYHFFVEKFEPSVMRSFLNRNTSMESKLLKTINGCIGAVKPVVECVSSLSMIKSYLRTIQATLPCVYVGGKKARYWSSSYSY